MSGFLEWEDEVNKRIAWNCCRWEVAVVVTFFRGGMGIYGLEGLKNEGILKGPKWSKNKNLGLKEKITPSHS